MDVLAHHRRPGGRELMVPRDATRIVTGRATQRGVVERRRRAFTSLSGATAGLLLLSVLFGGSLWLLFLLSATALGGYVTLLLNLKSQRQQANRVVRAFPHEHVDHEHVDHEHVGQAHGDRQVAHQPELARAAVGAESFGGLQVATRPDEPWQTSSGVRIRRWDA